MNSANKKRLFLIDSIFLDVETNYVCMYVKKKQTRTGIAYRTETITLGYVM